MILSPKPCWCHQEYISIALCYHPACGTFWGARCLQFGRNYWNLFSWFCIKELCNCLVLGLSAIWGWNGNHLLRIPPLSNFIHTLKNIRKKAKKTSKTFLVIAWFWMELWNMHLPVFLLSSFCTGWLCSRKNGLLTMKHYCFMLMITHRKNNHCFVIIHSSI